MKDQLEELRLKKGILYEYCRIEEAGKGWKQADFINGIRYAEAAHGITKNNS